jgi:bifunctional non-homologous end joining protein LigD
MLESVVWHQRRAALPQARQFCAFDILALDGDYLRQFPLSMRKTNLSGCWHVASTRSSVARSADLFWVTCRMGLEGLVSKRRDRPYQAGRSKHWIKVKNRKHPAMDRVAESFCL